MRRQTTDEDRARVLDMRKQRVSVLEIAKTLGMTKDSVYRIVRGAGGYTAQRPRITPEEIKRIKRLMDEGKGYQSIAREIGRNPSSVRAHIRKLQGRPTHPTKNEGVPGEPEFFTHYDKSRPKPKRCDDCGGMVYLPCVECFRRKQIEQQREAARCS